MNDGILRRDSSKLSPGFFTSWKLFVLGVPVGTLLGWCIMKVWQRLKQPRSSLQLTDNGTQVNAEGTDFHEPPRMTELAVRRPVDARKITFAEMSEVAECFPPDSDEKEKIEANGNDSGFIEAPSSPISSFLKDEEEDLCPSSPESRCQLPFGKSVISHSSTVSVQNAMPLIRPLPFGLDRERADIQLPTNIVGRFIGREGKNIKSLMDESGAQIHVQQQNMDEMARLVPCVIQGTHGQIMKVLELITIRHPDAIIPTKPFRPNPFSLSTSVMAVSPMRLLPAMVPIPMKWDAVIKPGNVPSSTFLGIVTHVEHINRFWLVSFDSTDKLDQLADSMAKTYYNCNSKEASIFEAIEDKPSDKELVGKYCAAQITDIHWLRGKIMDVVHKGKDKHPKYKVLLVDYGSTAKLESHRIKPLR